MIPNRVVWIVRGVASLMAVTAALTFFDPGVLDGPAYTNGNARGTALILLVIGVPLLLIAVEAARRGSARGLLVVLGLLAYFAYNGVLLLFLTPFNRLFLLYVATFGATIFATFAALVSLDPRSVVERLPTIPARGIAAYAWVLVGLNTLAWLGMLVPVMLSSDPAAYFGPLGVATNAVWVEDLSFWLPGAAIAAWLLWRREAWGVVLIGAWLVYGVVESIGVATDQWFGARADPVAAAGYEAVVALFVGLALVSLVPLSLYLRPLQTADAPRPAPRVVHA